MLRTALFFIVLWTSLLLSVIILMPIRLYGIFQPGNKHNKHLHPLIRHWARFMLFLAEVKVRKMTPESFPPYNYAIVANHQGNFDVLVILYSLPVIPAFISKTELCKIPLLSSWMKVMDCLPIDRSDSAGSRKKIWKRLQEKDRNPLLLFPEGTRSRKEELLPFRKGGLKMIYNSRTDVLPVRINGTYKVWEATKKIKPGTVYIEVKSLLKAEDYMKSGFNDFVKEIIHRTGP